jgi:peptidoglycan/xylan/chitin deacetylase (PgdA/CDA1 family)
LRLQILQQVACALAVSLASSARAEDPHEKVVVLTFDDASASHAAVGPLLKEYGFGATFFVCEYPGFENKTQYMTWEQIGALHRLGFEIGNHTLTHTHVDKLNAARFGHELEALEKKCAEQGVPKPVSFAYPAYVTSTPALTVLREHGYRWARAGGGKPFKPGTDDPLTIPSVSGSGEKTDRVLNALKAQQSGEIVVLTFHGAPDLAHPNVSVPLETLKVYLDYLRAQKFAVIAMRDLEKFVERKTAP